MALVRSMHEKPTRTAHPHRTEVNCEWTRVETPSGTLFQIASFGSDERKTPPGKVSQTLQFG